jgi:hypothetical protein
MEELILLRYLLQCSGFKAKHAGLLFGDNLGVIQNICLKDKLLKKKHVAISYPKSQECVAAGIAHPVKTPGLDRYADVLTKM